jgi:hypothetical protein
MRQEWEKLLRDLPVSINNLADPSILRLSTEAKLNQLVSDRHTGAVAIITKGDLSSSWWRERLTYWSENLNLFVFASISHLPKDREPAPTEPRYRTLKAARECGAKAIAYIRPIIHTVNDSPETITEMFTRSVDSGCHAIVSSGFRGDEQVVMDAGLEDVPAPDDQKWMRTLKLNSQASAKLMRELATQLNIPYWTRTQCAVSALMGKKRSLNPYYNAPGFVDCASCPIQGTCEGTAQFVKPLPHSIELLEYLGFQVEVHTASERYQKCPVEIRSQCSLCCTNCPKAPDMGMPYINIRGWDGSYPTWGEMSFARFLTGGMLSTDPLVPPGEGGKVRFHPKFEGKFNLYGINSWMAWSEYVPANKCFDCKYCFLSMFKDVLPPEYQVTVGMSPVQILNHKLINA